MNDSKRVVLYARVSSDDRGREGRNLAGQLEMCREYAEERSWRIVAELAEDDRGASGADFSLPQLTKALDMAARGEYEVLVTRELDRLARGLAKQLVIEQELKKSGVKLAYVLGEYPDTPEGALMKNVRAVIAEYERLKITERTTRARRRKVRNGHVMLHNVPAPFGYQKEDVDGKAQLVVVPEAAETVRAIFEWYTGPERLSMTAIMRRLTQQRRPTAADLNENYPGFQKKKRGFGEWCRASVARILSNETYAGTWHYSKGTKDGPNPRDQWLAVDVPAIIDEEQWETAQRRRKTNKQQPSARKHNYLLARRLKCGRCGASVSGNPVRSGGKLYLYYRCGAHKSRAGKYSYDCDVPYFRADHVDATVWGWFKGLLTDAEHFERMINAYRTKRDSRNEPLQRRLSATDDLLVKHRRKLEAVLDLYLDGDHSSEARAMFIERKQRLEQTIAALEDQRADIVAELGANDLADDQLDALRTIVSELALGFEEADDDFETRRKLIDALNLEAVLKTDGDKKLVSASCVFGEETLLPVSKASGSTRRPKLTDIAGYRINALLTVSRGLREPRRYLQV